MSSSGAPRLRNPVRTLYDEIGNTEASWTDALFWYLLGAISVGAVWIAG